MEAQLSIIIPSKNRPGLLRESLQHLKECLNNFNVEIIIINDGDDDIESLKKILPEIRIEKNKGSGVATARNFGAKLASSNLLLFMDDDMWMSEGALQRILDLHSQTNNLALNINWVYPAELNQVIHQTRFGRYLENKNFTSLKGWNFGTNWHDNKLFLTTGITSQNLSIRKELFFKVGGYNESFPHAGFEDYELSKRLTSNGVKISIDPTVMMFHNEADRVNISAWLERKKRGAETRAVAVTLGHHELRLSYSKSKKFLLQVISQIQPLLIKFVSNPFLDKMRFLDAITFKIVDALLAMSIYQGSIRASRQNT